MNLFKSRKSLTLFVILLIVCLLSAGCGSRASDSTLPEIEENQEVQIHKDDEDHSKQAENKNPADIVLNEMDPEKNTNGDVIGETQEKSDEAKTDSVTLSIVGPEDVGVILEPTDVEIEEGETVLDVLKKIAKQKNIPVSVRGKNSSAYVEGINNIFEFDHGAKSGWLYKVNGSFYSKSSGVYKLEPGDVVEWVYTLDLGKDVGADLTDLGGVTGE